MTPAPGQLTKIEFTCKAFDIIPLVIVLARSTHKNPFPGDRGIQYEPLSLKGE
jgi:hypothetical protein